MLPGRRCSWSGKNSSYKYPGRGVHQVKQAVDWQQQLYETKAAGLLLYGRALGLGHGEAEDVLPVHCLFHLMDTTPRIFV